MDCLDGDCSGLELVPVVSSGDARIRALGQFIDTHPRGELPDEVKYAFFYFCNNRDIGWDVLKFIHYCLAHDSISNVALALVVACEDVVKNQKDIAASLCEMLAEGVTTFRFKYVHANVHSRLFQLIGVQAPPYRQQDRAVTTKAPPRYLEFLGRDPKTQPQAFSQFQGRDSKTQPQAFSQGRTVFQPNAPNTPPAKARAVYTPVAMCGGGQMVRQSNQNNTVELQRIAQQVQQVLAPFMDQMLQAVKIQDNRLDLVEDNAAMNEAKIASLHTEFQQTRADNASEFQKSRAESAAQSAAQHKQLMDYMSGNNSAAPAPSFPQPPQRPLAGTGFSGAGAGAASVFPIRGAGAGAASVGGGAAAGAAGADGGGAAGQIKNDRD
jgi:hypothetical protein